MAEDKKCNGWTNYETWTVALFIQNESNECIRDAERACKRDDYGDGLKEFVREYFIEECDGEEHNLFVQQMLSAAMSEVDWQELHDSFLEDADEDEDEDADEDE